MKKVFTVLVCVFAIMIPSVASNTISYELNGGVSNEYGWMSPEDMYQDLAADIIAANGNGYTFSFMGDFGSEGHMLFGPADVTSTTGIAHDIWTFDMNFLRGYAGGKWDWLQDYIEGISNEAGIAWNSSNAMRYALAAFFQNSVRTTWPYSADYTICGVNSKAYYYLWGHSFANPTAIADGESFTLNNPYKENCIFYGWYDNASFNGEPVTSITSTTTGTLYAKWGQPGGCGENLTWSYANNVLTISGTGAMSNFTSVDMPWYSIRNSITSVILNEGVTSIGDRAFYDCTGLTSIIIPNSVTSIGSSAFANCSGLTSLSIPNSVISIGANAFYNCSGLTSLSIPNSVISIGANAFYNCSGFTNINIPSGVTSVEASVFYKCTNLRSIIIPDGVASIGASAFYNCSGLTSINIPNSVTSIGTLAFFGCSGLTNISIPDGITSIETAVFRNCSGLTSITIPEAVTSIGERAFQGCTGLTSITCNAIVPPSVGSNCFYNVSTFIPVYIPCCSMEDYQTSDGWSNFSNLIEPNVCACERNYVINYTATEKLNETTNYYYSGLHTDAFNVSITNHTFSDGIGTIHFSGDVTSIGNNAFLNCTGLTSIIIPNSVTSIGSDAFANCTGLTNINIPSGVTSVEASVFYNCTNLRSIIIPDGVASIGASAFYNCSGLTSINIPNSVTSIGTNAFSDCSALTLIVVEVGNAIYDSRNNCNAIIETASNKLIRGCKNTVIPNSVTSIGESAFSVCSGLASVAIPNSVTSIGANAFYNCSDLESVTFGNSLILLEDRAFAGDYQIADIYVSALTPPTGEENVFSGVSQHAYIHVPTGTVRAYQMTPLWSKFLHFFEMSFELDTLIELDTSFELVDNRTPSFANSERTLYSAGITYKRNFTYTGKWCPLYIPINVDVNAEFLAEFDVAEIFAYARLYDTNGDGVLDADDAPYLVVQKLSEGQRLEANYPYLIRPKTTGEKTLVSADNILYPSEENQISCSTTQTKYVFTGNYSTRSFVNGDGNYFITTQGTIGQAATTTTLYSFRWYMNKFDNNEGYPIYDTPYPIEARIIAIGEEVDESTALEAITVDSANESSKLYRKNNLIYTVMGQVVGDIHSVDVNSLPKGFYIVNGKRMLVH